MILRNTGVHICLYSLLFTVLVLFPPFSASAQTTSQISQHGITWTFDHAYQYGQFANGDYWVQGPAEIVNISPASVVTGGRTINGSMINPSPRLGTTQGYDSSMYSSGSYNAGLNVARPNNQQLSESNPLTIQAGSSLVSTISASGAGVQPQTAAVLTVLSSSAPTGSFRPSYVNVAKNIRFNVSQLDYSALGRLSPVGSVPRLQQQAGDSQSASVERMFERVWLDHVPNWFNRALHPVENMRDYGRDIAAQVGIGALMLQLNYSNQQKETLLIRMVQLGIDNYGIVQDGGERNWINNGGHNSGRKFPILLAGVVLNDTGMRNIGQRSGDYLYSGSYGSGNEPPDYVHFGEDDQTFYIAQSDVNITHSGSWDPDSRDTQRIPYDQVDIGQPEWGIRHSNDPGASNKFWDTFYRRCCNATAWAGFTLAAHVMGLRNLWNHNVLFDYMDRYMQVTAGAYPGNRQNTSQFAEAMWDTYRDNYAPVWVMNNPSDPYSLGHYAGGGPPPPPLLYGDVSENGQVSAYDASLCAQSAVGLISLTSDQITKADVTGNGSVSASDASWIARKAVDPNVVFPAEEQ